MTDAEFKSIVKEYKVYLKPALFTIIIENAGIFSDQIKMEIIDELKKADGEMKDLYEYQEKRNSKMEKWVKKFEDFYKNLKDQFKQAAKKDMVADKSRADQLISNL